MCMNDLHEFVVRVNRRALKNVREAHRALLPSLGVGNLHYLNYLCAVLDVTWSS